MMGEGKPHQSFTHRLTAVRIIKMARFRDFARGLTVVGKGL
jgi:hypothetical protein